MSWIEKTLGDLISIKRGYDLPEHQRVFGDIPIVGSAGITGFHNKAKVFGGGVTLGRSGNSFGKVYKCKSDFWPHNATLYVNDFKGNSSDYVYYFLKTINFNRYNSGSAQPSLNRNYIYPIKIQIPPFQTQKRIADILSAYDDLIENNLKRIKLLEQAAQNIYKEWFVNMHFPGCENTLINEETGLPEGWEIKSVGEVFKINIGKTPPRKEPEWFSFEKGYKWVSISDMNKSIVFIQKTKERITDEGVNKFNVKIVPKGTVLLSFKLTIGSVVIATEDMVTNEAIAHFNIDETTSLSTEYTYCFLTCFPYKTLGSSSSIGEALNSKVVKSISVLVPQLNLVNLFTENVNPIFKQLENLVIQNQKLKAARDILLPRLMNQSIEV